MITCSWCYLVMTTLFPRLFLRTDVLWGHCPLGLLERLCATDITTKAPARRRRKKISVTVTCEAIGQLFRFNCRDIKRVCLFQTPQFSCCDVTEIMLRFTGTVLTADRKTTTTISRNKALNVCNNNGNSCGEKILVEPSQRPHFDRDGKLVNNPWNYLDLILVSRSSAQLGPRPRHQPAGATALLIGL